MQKDKLKKYGLPIGVGVFLVGVEECIRRIRKKAQNDLQKEVDNSLPKLRNRDLTIPDDHVQLTILKDIDLSKYKETPMSEKEITEWKSLFSTIGSETMKTNLNISSFNGLLKCDVPLKDLCRVSGNPDAMRGMVISDGTIKQQASFTEAGIGNMAPLMVFQCMAAVTSQYYQQVVSERLNEIDNKLDSIIKIFAAEDKAKLKVSYNRFVELSKKNSFDKADKQIISDFSRDVEIIREKYRYLLADISTDTLKVKYDITDKKEACLKKKALKDSQYFEYLKMAMQAEVLTCIASVISMKIAIALNNEEDAENCANKITFEFWDNYEDQFYRIKHDVTKYLELEAKKSFFHSKQIELWKKRYLEEFNDVKKSMIEMQKPFECRTVQYISRQGDGSLKKYIDINKNDLEEKN